MLDRVCGKRVNIRKLTLSDAHDIFEHCKHKDILRYTGIPFNPYKLEHAEKFIKNVHREHRRKIALHRGIEDPNTKRIISMISIDISKHEYKSGSIGYWLGKKYWGKGIMKEALRLFVLMAFKRLNLNRIFAHVFHYNIRSSKLLENSGFTLEGRLRKYKKYRNRYIDMLIYSMLKEEQSNLKITF